VLLEQIPGSRKILLSAVISVLGDNNIIGERSGIKRSILWKNNVLETNTH